MAAHVEPYRTYSPWSDPGRWAPLLREISPEPQRVVRAVSGLLMHPFIAPVLGVAIPEAALGDRTVRAVSDMLDHVRSRDDHSLAEARAVDKRFFCVCSGFARIAQAVFQTHAIPARSRVGFAAYLNPGFFEDHWVCEYWDGRQWRLLDAQLDETNIGDFHISFEPWDVPRDQFLDASTTWRRLRSGALSPDKVGLSVIGLSGWWFAAQSVLRDVAALNQIEMLPWETWSVGGGFEPGRDIAPQMIDALDKVANQLAGSPDADLAQRVYRENPWIKVTPKVLSFVNGVPEEITLVPPP